MNLTIQCDVDGTVCDTRTLTPKLATGELTPQEMWQETATTPQPIRPVLDWLHAHRKAGTRIVYVSGRTSVASTRNTLKAVGAPDGEIRCCTGGMEPSDFKLLQARDLRPDVVLDDDPTVCTLMYRAMVPAPKIILVPGWRFEERDTPITPQLPPAPQQSGPLPNPTGQATVALYSGGVDSYCMAALTDPDVLLNVNLGGRYGHAETTHLTTPPGMEDRLVRLNLPLGDLFEMADHSFILPARNAILALLGAQYGHRVMMGATASQHGSDKDEGFEEQASNLLRYIWKPQPRWNPDGRDTYVDRPVAHLTKRQLVEAAVATGRVTGEQIRDDTFSCYTPTDDGAECGHCMPCGRKWAALAANNIPPTVDGRPGFQQDAQEVLMYQPDTPPHRTAQYVTDTLDAIESRW